jgi:hypothetical protein
VRVHRTGLGTRVAGTLLGISFLAFGATALAMSRNAPDAYLADRAVWMGVTFMIAGVAAIAVSWLVADLSNIWCRQVPRSRRGPLDGTPP